MLIDRRILRMLIDMDNGKVYGTVMQEAARDVFVCFAGMTDI